MCDFRLILPFHNGQKEFKLIYLVSLSIDPDFDFGYVSHTANSIRNRPSEIAKLGLIM